MQTITEQGAASVAITVTAGKLDGMRHTDPAVADCVYLEMHVHYGHGKYDHDLVSGWVRPNIAALLKAAPDLLKALQRIGNPEFRYSSDDDEDTQLSLRIADARAAIAKARGAA